MNPGNRPVAKALAFSPAAFGGHPLRALVEVALRDLVGERILLSRLLRHVIRRLRNLASAVGFADTGSAPDIALPCLHARPNTLLPESAPAWSARQ